MFDENSKLHISAFNPPEIIPIQVPQCNFFKKQFQVFVLINIMPRMQ